MKISKKILILLAVLIVFVAIFFIIKSNKIVKTNNAKEEVFLINYTHEERVEIIKNILAEKFSVLAEESTVLIGREVPGFINGIFLSEELAKQNKENIYFYAVLDKEPKVVWTGTSDPDCAVLKKHNFPIEMKGSCN